jgi:predicted nucleic acid-binding protein
MTTTAVDRVFIDTNILVFAQLALAPHHAAAVARLNELAAGGAEVWISRQVLREYLSAMTKPGVLTGTIPITSLAADVQKFENYFQVAEDGPPVTVFLIGLICTIQVLGKQIHDANIVATMQAHGIPKLLTHNTADFARYSSIITVVPLIP